MGPDEFSKPSDYRFTSLLIKNDAMINAAEGRTVGHSAATTATAKAVVELVGLVREMNHEIEALRAELDQRTEGHD